MGRLFKALLRQRSRTADLTSTTSGQQTRVRFVAGGQAGGGKLAAAAAAALRGASPAPVAVHHRLEALEDRRMLSGAPNYYQGTLTIGGDPNHGHHLSAWLSADGKSVVGAVDNTTLTEPLSKVTRIKVIGENYPDIIWIDSRIKLSTTMDGMGGNDTITGGDGPSSITGGAGNDSIQSGNGDSWVSGGYGNDTITLGTGTDYANGGAGNDSITGGSGNDIIDGGGGVNTATNIHTGDDVVNTTSDTAPGANTFTQAPLGAKITADSDTTVYNGFSVNFNATGSGLGVGTPLTARYQWNFGDTNPAAKYNAIEGFSAAHVYDLPGTYTVTLTVTNQNGQSATTTTQVTIKSQSAMRTIYVSPTGNDRNAGTSSGAPVQTIARAQQLMASNTRILFQAGGTYDTTAGLYVNNYMSDVLIGSYGTGAKPVLNYTGPIHYFAFIGAGGGVSNVVVAGLTFDSIYGYTTDKSGAPYAIHPIGTNWTIRNNEFLNVSYAVDASGNPTGLLVQDNTAPSPTGLRAYFVWAQGSDISILGNTVANSTREHIVRVGGAARLNIQYNNFTNLDRSKTDPQDTAKGCIVVQKGSYAYVAHNTVLQGGIGVGPLGGSGGVNDKGASFNWAVFDGNFFNGPAFEFDPGVNHAILRNNIFRRDNGQAITVQAYDPVYNRIVNDVEIVGNTVINYGTQGNFLKVAGRANGIILDDNLYSAPNLITGAFSTAPVYVADSGLTSFTEVRHNTWPIPADSLQWIGHEGINYVWTFWSDSRGYLTQDQWNNLAKVDQDLFQTQYVGSSSAPAAGSTPSHYGVKIPGLWADYNGKARPATGVSDGAIQM